MNESWCQLRREPAGVMDARKVATIEGARMAEGRLPTDQSPRDASLGRRVGGLLGWLALAYGAAAVGAVASASAETFYLQLARPAWAPPAWLFGPVWSVLYGLMGVAAWLVWRVRGFARARVPLLLFMAQLAANGLWSWLFFAWHLGALSFVEVLVLWGLVAATAVTFWQVRPLAGALLLPYLAWVTFASALNLALWRLNPHLLQ